METIPLSHLCPKNPHQARRNVSLDEWKELAADERAALLGPPPEGEDPGRFNADDKPAPREFDYLKKEAAT